MDSICYVQYYFDLSFFEYCVQMMNKPVGLVIYDYLSLSEDEKNILERETNIRLYRNINETEYKYTQYVVPQQSNLHQEILIEIICDLLEHGKSVQCYKRIFNDEELTKIMYMYGEKFLYVPQIYKSNFEISINCPVIYICSDHTDSRKTDIQMKLSQEFQKNGAIVSNISYDEWTDLLQYHRIPQDIFNFEDDIDKKNHLFKQFVENVISTDNPDVVIVNIPGNMIPFDKELPNTSWVANYFSSVLKPDFIILGLMSLEYKEISSQVEYVKYLMKKRVDNVILTDHSVNIYRYDDEKVVDSIKLNINYVNSKFEEIVDNIMIDCDVYSYHSNSWQEKIFEKFFAKFAVTRSKDFSVIGQV